MLRSNWKSEQGPVFPRPNMENTAAHKNGRFDVIMGKICHNSQQKHQQNQSSIMASSDFHSDTEQQQHQDQEFDFILALTATAAASSSTASQPSQPTTPPLYFDNNTAPKHDGCPVSALLPVVVSVENGMTVIVDSNEGSNEHTSVEENFNSRLTAITTTTITTSGASTTSTTTKKKRTKKKSVGITKKGRRISSNSSNSTVRCPVCSQTYSRKDNLRAHMRIHSGERPYQCKQCSNAFRWLGALRKHVANEHGDNNDHDNQDESKSDLHGDRSENVNLEKISNSDTLQISSSLSPQLSFTTAEAATKTTQQQTAELESNPVPEVCLLPGSFPATTQSSTNLKMPSIPDLNDETHKYVTYTRTNNMNSNVDNNSSVLTTNNMEETKRNRVEENGLPDVLCTLPDPWALPEPIVSTFLELTPNFLSVAPKS